MFLCSSIAFSIGLDIVTEDDDDNLDPKEQANCELYKDLYARVRTVPSGIEVRVSRSLGFGSPRWT